MTFASLLSVILRCLPQAGIAFVSVTCFSILFQVPPKQRAFTGFTGALGWFVNSVCVALTLSPVTAAFFAALTLSYFARVMCYVRKEPITSFLICGIFPIVPGAGIYYTAFYFFMGDNAMGMSKGFETIKIAVAIALGIGIVISLPAFFFAFGKSKPPRQEDPS